jgi:hypothetical protein
MTHYLGFRVVQGLSQLWELMLHKLACSLASIRGEFFEQVAINALKRHFQIYTGNGRDLLTTI